MKDTYIKNKLKELEIRIEKLEKERYFVGVDLAKEKDKTTLNGELVDIPESYVKEIISDAKQNLSKNNPQENYKQSVDEKERIAKTENPKPPIGNVSTTEVVGGKSPADNVLDEGRKIKSKEKKDVKDRK